MFYYGAVAYPAIFVICTILGTASGMQMQYLALTAGIMLVLGPDRIGLACCFGIVGVLLVLALDIRATIGRSLDLGPLTASHGSRLVCSAGRFASSTHRSEARPNPAIHPSFRKGTAMRFAAGMLAMMVLFVPDAGMTSPILRPLVTVEPAGHTIDVVERRHIRRPGGRPNAVRRDVRRDRPAVRREIRRDRPDVRRNTIVRNRTIVVRPVRPWIRRPYYGTVVAGVAMGTVMAVAAIPRAPSPDLCWYWSNSSQTRGYWDYCVPR